MSGNNPCAAEPDAFRRRASRMLPISLLFCTLSLTSCSSLLTNTVISPALSGLRQQTDIQLVCQGAPSYLLMLDSMIAADPDSTSLLTIASQAYSGYAATLEECGGEERLDAIADKAGLYGKRLLSQYLPFGAAQTNEEELDKALGSIGSSDLPAVFWGSYGWLSWVKKENGSAAAVADLVTIEKIMNRLLEIDEAYEGGSIHLFFGIYHAAKPAMFGGKPELARTHFERALELSKGRNLMIQTAYAELYARTQMDGELHKRLLEEVIHFDLQSAPEYALANRLAVAKAQRLLEEDYFAE